MADWFVLNARDARWVWNEMGGYCNFEEGDTRFEQVGVNLNVLHPGVPMAMYHEEPGQEDFLVLSGECLLVVEGEERLLRQWDFFHCAPWTRHTFVGAGDGPCALLSIGARHPDEDIVYAVDDVAARHRACVTEETDDPTVAYPSMGWAVPQPARKPWPPR